MSSAIATRNNNRAIVPADLPPAIAQIAATAQIYVESGLLPRSVDTWQKAVVIIQTGRELGWGDMAALRNIHVIEGKPSISAAGLAGIIQKTHGDNALIPVETDDRKATYQYKRREWDAHRTFTFTIEMAQKAGLTNKLTWKNYPAAMLRSRVISFIAQSAFQAETGGVLTAEELGAPVNAEGDVIPSGTITVVERSEEMSQAGDDRGYADIPDKWGPGTGGGPPLGSEAYAGTDYGPTRTINPSPAGQEPNVQKVTDRQLKFIQALAREAGMSEQQTQIDVAARYGCEMREMSRRQASAYVEVLKPPDEASVDLDTGEVSPEPDAGDVIDAEFTEDGDGMTWTAFWAWARPQGYNKRGDIEKMIGQSIDGMTPLAVMQAIQNVPADDNQLPVEEQERNAAKADDPETRAMKRLHAVGRERNLKHEDLNLLGWAAGMPSLKELNAQDLSELCKWIHETDDEGLAEEIMKGQMNKAAAESTPTKPAKTDWLKAVEDSKNLIQLEALEQEMKAKQVKGADVWAAFSQKRTGFMRLAG